MKSTPDDLVTAAASDPALAQLCDEIIERLQAGDGVDMASLALEHPEHADQLRRLLPAIEALVDLGASSASQASHHVSNHGTSALAPRVLGDYRILREIGRGGMGVVYEAEQRSLNRRVALKVLPMAAALDTRQFQRFQLEAQAAACLHHNNIVPVFAVGTEGGVPFYAMQYIEGRTLADIIQELRRAEGLEEEPPTREGGAVPRLADVSTTALARSLVTGQAAAPRIDATGPTAPTDAHGPVPSPLPAGEGQGEGLMPAVGRPSKTASSTRTRDYCRNIANLGLQAAEALDHAHTRGILHRDIKPANLLLDAEGRLWVTDFGLAQIQGNHGLTLTGDILGTLRYMSPEQALARRVVIDGRTDVYSLGVTLYELLTLRPAFDGTDRAEILRKIGEHDPTPLRKLNASVPQDLETIIHKGMAKEPSERYATARDLADDLRNLLEDRPIRARRPSLLDRAAKWGRRHTASVAAASVILVLAMIGLTAGILLISHEQRRTTAAKKQAEDRYVLARKAVDEMYTQVAEKWLERGANLTAIQREFLEKALAFYEAFAAERSGDPRTRLDVALARIRVAKIHEALGMFDRGEVSLHQAVDGLEALTAAHPQNVEYRNALAGALTELGNHYFLHNRLHEAELLLIRGITIREALVAQDPNYRDYLNQVALGLLCLGNVRSAMGDHAQAEPSFRRSRARYEALHEEVPANVQNTARLAEAEDCLGAALFRTGRVSESERARRRALALREKLLSDDPKNPDLRYAVAMNLVHLYGDLRAHGKLNTTVEVIESARRSVDLLGELAAEFPLRPKYTESLARNQSDLSWILFRLGRADQIEGVIRPAVATAEWLVRKYPKYPEYRYKLTLTLNALAGALWLSGKNGEAERMIRRSTEILEGLMEEYPDREDYLRDLAGTIQTLAEWKLTCPDVRYRDAGGALELSRRSVELYPGGDLNWKWLSAIEYCNGHWDAAIHAAEKCIELRGDGGWAFQWLILALSHARRGEMDQARNWYAKVRPALRDSKGMVDTPRGLIDEAVDLLGKEPPQENAKSKPVAESTSPPE